MSALFLRNFASVKFRVNKTHAEISKFTVFLWVLCIGKYSVIMLFPDCTQDYSGRNVYCGGSGRLVHNVLEVLARNI